MPLKLKEINISNTLKRLIISTDGRQTTYKYDPGVELGSTEKQLQLSGQNGKKLRGEVLRRRKIFSPVSYSNRPVIKIT